jgi:hypothetical protein
MGCESRPAPRWHGRQAAGQSFHERSRCPAEGVPTNVPTNEHGIDMDYVGYGGRKGRADAGIFRKINASGRADL